uniref:Deltameth_res domain-containing protein n=1 Tax=Heterorhabditis bacteriophora TaxID=37862 RepID=A0A1I7X787_HETBA
MKYNIGLSTVDISTKGRVRPHIELEPHHRPGDSIEFAFLEPANSARALPRLETIGSGDYLLCSTRPNNELFRNNYTVLAKLQDGHALLPFFALIKNSQRSTYDRLFSHYFSSLSSILQTIQTTDMNRAVFSRFLNAYRTAVKQPKRSGSGGHHEVVNPGPPVTFDYMPVPFQPYSTVYNELQAKFNVYLIASSVLLAVSLGSAIYTDLFIWDALSTPKSYRNRH